MTEVTERAQPLVVSRDLTYEEVADLDRLRAALASAVDRTRPSAVSALWDSMVSAHGGRSAPVGFVEAVATALGDLLAVHVPTVRWSVWPGPHGPTLGVASDARPHAPVVPFLDARDRWDTGARGWIVDYLARATTHLAAVAVPQPRPAPDDRAAVHAAAAPRLVPAEPSPVGVDAPPPVPPAPTHVPDAPLQDFALDALEHAMALLRETGPFDREVFVLLMDGTGRRTESCPGGGAEGRSRARELVRSSGARRAAITWVERDPADLPGPRQAFPAVLVDAWDAGERGLRVGRRFVDDVLGTGPLGGPLVVGSLSPLL